MSLDVPRIRHIGFVGFAASLGLLWSLCATLGRRRLAEPPYIVDIRDLAGRSLIVFRGRVATVDLIGENPHPSIRRNAVAVFQADRWYRGEARAIPPLSFTFGTVFSNGHNCIDFRPDSYWIVFAVETSGHLELIDDCIGALTVAPLLGANLGNADWLVQMEADFIAGLER